MIKSWPAYGSPILVNTKSTFQAGAALAADDGMTFLPETGQMAESAKTPSTAVSA